MNPSERVAERIQELLDLGVTPDQIRAQKDRIRGDVLGPGPWREGAVLPTDAQPPGQMPGPTRPRPAAPARAAAAPVPTASAPQAGGLDDYGRALASGFSDVITLGEFDPESNLEGAEAAEKRRRQDVREGRGDSVFTASPEDTQRGYDRAQQEAYSVARHPYISLIGQLLGAPLSLGTRIGNGMLRLLPAASAGGKILASSAAAGLGAGGEATARDLVAGESLTEALKSGAYSAGPGAITGGAITGLNLRLRNPRTLTGQYVEGREHGKSSGLYDSAEYKGPGLFDDPATTPAGHPESMQGTGDAARVYGGRVLKANVERYNQMNKDWEAGMDHPARHTPTDVSQFMEDVNASVKRYSNNRPVDKAVAREAGEAAKNLSRKVEQFEPVPGPAKAEGARSAIPVERKSIEGPGRTDVYGTTDVAGAMAEAQARAAQMEQTRARAENPNTRPRHRRGGLYAKPERKLLTAPKEEKALMPRRDTETVSPEYDQPIASEQAPPGDVEMRSTGKVSKPIATIDDLITQKQAWKEAAEFGRRPTKNNRPYRKMYQAAVAATKRLADTHPDPAIREAAKKQLAADERFLAEALDLEDTNARLFGKKKAALEDTVSARRRAGNELLQVMKDTQASGTRLEDFRALKAKGGKVGKAVRDAGAKMADEATTFSLDPRTFGHTGKWGGALTGAANQLTEWAKVRGIEPLSRYGGQTALQVNRLTDPSESNKATVKRPLRLVEPLLDPIAALLASLAAR